MDICFSKPHLETSTKFLSIDWFSIMKPNSSNVATSLLFGWYNKLALSGMAERCLENGLDIPRRMKTKTKPWKPYLHILIFFLFTYMPHAMIWHRITKFSFKFCLNICYSLIGTARNSTIDFGGMLKDFRALENLKSFLYIFLISGEKRSMSLLPDWAYVDFHY